MSTIDIIRPFLAQCGYPSHYIRTNYAYSDGQGVEHKIDLVAFASGEVLDYRTSCIGIVDGTSVKGDYQNWINSFRGLGAPIIFSCFEDKLDWWKVTSQNVVL